MKLIEFVSCFQLKVVDILIKHKSLIQKQIKPIVADSKVLGYTKPKTIV